MVAHFGWRRLLNDPRAATALEYGIIGGVLALLLGLLFLEVGPNLAATLAGMARRMSGIHGAE